MKTIGQIIGEERTAKGWSQTQLARIIGVNQPALCRNENDQATPTLFTAICIADALDISLDYLTGRTDVKEVQR